jgi:hypothetical protein
VEAIISPKIGIAGDRAGRRQEAVTGEEDAGVAKIADDLSRVVDADGHRTGSARHVELGEAAAGVEETVDARAAVKTTRRFALSR